MGDDEVLKVVFETVNPAEVAVIKSLFGGADIPYIARGEDQYDAFRGAFRGTVFGSRGRPVTFLVPADLLEEARLVLGEGN